MKPNIKVNSNKRRNGVDSDFVQSETGSQTSGFEKKATLTIEREAVVVFRKKVVEDFSIRVLSFESRRNKSIRNGNQTDSSCSWRNEKAWELRSKYKKKKTSCLTLCCLCSIQHL
jgi:hypothetical protein